MKVLKYISIYLIVLFGVQNMFAQTAHIPDESFLQFLKTNYSTTIDANDELIITEAESISGALNCSNSGISDLQGIQYFTGINRLYASGNQITEVPELSGLTNLLTLHIADNTISSLPDLTSLERLNELIAYDNQIVAFPDVSHLNELQILNVYSNQIDSMPDLSNLSALKKLDVSGNPIQNIEFLNGLTELQELNMWGLRISQTPDFSGFKDLIKLNLGTNYLSSPPNLSSLTNLEEVYLNDNLFTKLPEGLLSLSELNTVLLRNNHLSFEDLIPITKIENYNSIFTIYPQQLVPLNTPEEIKENQLVNIKIDFNDNTNDLVYRWFKDSNLIRETDSPVLVIDNFTEEDNGNYHAEITSAQIPGFYISSNSVDLTVKPCLDITEISTDQNFSCKAGNSVTVTSRQEIKEVSLISGKDSLYSSNGYFSALKPGFYNIIVATDNCFSMLKKEIEIESHNCNEVLLTPDGDGINDTYFFEESGKAEVFDKGGNKVAEFKIPHRWKATGINGKLPIGYYFISINGGKHLNMSIIY